MAWIAQISCLQKKIINISNSFGDGVMLDSFWYVFDRLLVILGIIGFLSIIGGLLFIGIFLLRIMDSPNKLPPNDSNHHQ